MFHKSRAQARALRGQCAAHLKHQLCIASFAPDGADIGTDAKEERFSGTPSD
jgi:hypothetical protein